MELDGKPGVFIATAGGGRGQGQQAQAAAVSRRRTRRHARARAQPATGGGPVRVSHRAPQPSRPSSCPSQTGIRDGEHIEITSGLNDGARVITTGAGALKDGDRIVAASGDGRSGRGERANREGRSGQVAHRPSLALADRRSPPGAKPPSKEIE